MTMLTLRDIRARKAKRKRLLERNLEAIRKQLEKMGALKIIVFGSLAGGCVRSTSDLDIISIMPATRSGKQWMKAIYDGVERDVDCDILAYTPRELEKAVPISRFLRHALKTGRVIYEKRPQG